jgi:CheY-like chemotaxis protein
MPIPIVLVAEDDQADQYFLTLLLKKFDYDVQVVSSGEEAIAALAKNTYAAVLMDVTLPGIDRYEFAERVRLVELESGRQTPVIALIPNVDTSNHCEIIPPALADSMTKPFKPEELRKVLLRYVYDSKWPNLKTLKPLPPEESDIDSATG